MSPNGDAVAALTTLPLMRSLLMLIDLRKVLFLVLLSVCSLTLNLIAQGFSDTSAWTTFVLGSGPTVHTTATQLIITIPATSVDDPARGVFGAGLETTCLVSGDFDVQVDYRLLEWPATNGARIGLGTAFGAVVERTSFSSHDAGPAGEAYLTDFDGSFRGITSTTDMFGTLRLMRVGGTFTGYYADQSGGWITIHSGPGPTDALVVGPLAWSHNYSFSDQLVEVAFENFQVNAGEVPCLEPITVKIDIIPGRSLNSINLASNATIPVGILGTADFMASTTDASTVRFGATRTEAIPIRFSLQDVNGDGHVDLFLQFRIRDTKIACGDTAAILTGQTSNGEKIQGEDAIITVGCK
jgi:hypothetical protein